MIGAIAEPGFLEGGDFFPVGQDLALVGIGLRSNFEACQQLMDSDVLGCRRWGSLFLFAAIEAIKIEPEACMLVTQPSTGGHFHCALPACNGVAESGDVQLSFCRNSYPVDGKGMFILAIQRA